MNSSNKTTPVPFSAAVPALGALPTETTVFVYEPPAYPSMTSSNIENPTIYTVSTAPAAPPSVTVFPPQEWTPVNPMPTGWRTSDANAGRIGGAGRVIGGSLALELAMLAVVLILGVSRVMGW